jgi:hypothetical protein
MSNKECERKEKGEIAAHASRSCFPFPFFCRNGCGNRFSQPSYVLGCCLSPSLSVRVCANWNKSPCRRMKCKSPFNDARKTP